MPFANASGATIHYAAEGGGRDTLLLVMGLGGHASEWGAAFVADLASDHRVVRMDNRGIAQSLSAAPSWTLEDMANDVIAVVDALGLKSVALIGTSMGGMIAQLVAARHPSRVSRLVLMSTSFGGAQSVPPTERGAAALAPSPGMTVAEQRRRGLRTLTSDAFADDHAELIELLVAQRERNPTPGPTFKLQFEAILLSDRSQLVKDIRCPTLVIHGDDDPLVPIQNGRMLAERIPGSTFALLEGCGHLPHLERAEETAKLIREFLAAPR
jgi:3-oxoadipate enol-lactonase